MKIVLYLFALIHTAFFADGGIELISSSLFELGSSSSDKAFQQSSTDSNSGEDNKTGKYTHKDDTTHNMEFSLDDFKEIPLENPD